MGNGWAPGHVARCRISLRMLLTEQCNLSCVFCHNEGQENGSRFLEISDHRLVEVVTEAQSMGTVQIKFSGGEPTIHPRLKHLMSAACDAGCEDLVLISNGMKTAAFEPLLGRFPFRVSVNMPAADDLSYFRITGGRISPVLATIRLLSSAAVPVAFNTYWPAHRPPARLRGLMRLARDLGCVLKVLTPCHLVGVNTQEEAALSIGKWLAADGFRQHDTLNHITVYLKDGLTVRVQRPWCPVYCQALAGKDVTLRINAAGLIRSCLQDAGPSYGSALGTMTELREGLASAVAAAGQDCAAAPKAPRVGVRSVRRNSGQGMG